jgi:N-methylhydantoinase A/oxoprolinase/acetone carboxylase beta subunit
VNAVVGIDVGGTFTDLFQPGIEGGPPRVVKVPSRPDDPSMAVMDALTEATSIRPDSSSSCMARRSLRMR